MTDKRRTKREATISAGVGGIRLENGDLQTDGLKEDSGGSEGSTPRDTKMKSASQSPIKQESSTDSPENPMARHEEVVGGDITLKMEPGQPPKLARSSSQKIVAGPARLYNDYADKTEEARDTFQVLSSCVYSSKYIGSTEHESLECDCAEEWDSLARVNRACGDDDACINRATKMECVGDHSLFGADCMNQRFQKQEFADVTVIKTEKKGYGLRANTDLHPNEFIYEYIGEVINEGQFRKRMLQYDEEGVKHFYFMSLNKGEFVDATKRGNLGRFCNHSCNPNCYVDKWVVGEKLRMGIFAERKIKAGEELVFNYNVDRYGANPQPCYCGEPNCTGFIGGKTQTERATKLSNTTIEALGIDDGDGWDTAVAKKPRKKKAGEDDEEYVSSVQPKSLDENGVTKVMATLMQCKEKWIAVKLLGRIQRCDDANVRNRVVKMHGYQILNSTLSLWKEDANIVLQVFDILKKFPLITRNKINDSKIETTVESLRSLDDERVRSDADWLLSEWNKLEVGYRIPRKKREDATGTPDKSISSRFGRRDSRDERKARSVSPKSPDLRSRSRSIDAPRGPAAANGLRSNVPQRGPSNFGGPRPPFRPRPFNALPSGWFMATDQDNRTYFYDASGKTTWERPTQPAAPPPPPPKPSSTNKALEDIINEITNAKASTPKDKSTAVETSKSALRDVKKDDKAGQEKWRSYNEEKQKKIYENTLFPHVKSVMDKFKGKLPKEDLKRFAKEISKKLVNSDYKHNRVKDPTKCSEKQEKQVKKYVREFFEKAVEKDKGRQKKRAECKAMEGKEYKSPVESDKAKAMNEENGHKSDDDQDMAMSDEEEMKIKPECTTPATPLDQLSIADKLKRKRAEEIYGLKAEDDESTPSKRLKSETPPPPPPPPPAPADGQCPEAGSTSDEMMGGDLDTPLRNSENGMEAPSPPPPPPPPPPCDPASESGFHESAVANPSPHTSPGNEEGSRVEDDSQMNGQSSDEPHAVEA